MKERLEIIQERYNHLCDELLKPEVYEDYKRMQTISKEKNAIECFYELLLNISQLKGGEHNGRDG